MFLLIQQVTFTGQALETYTLPTSDNYQSWTLTADSGSNQTIASGNTVDIAGTANNIFYRCWRYRYSNY